MLGEPTTEAVVREPDPEVTAEVASEVEPRENWYSAPVAVALTLNDGSTAGIEYRIGDDAWRAYKAPIRIDEDGSHEVALSRHQGR